MANKPTSEPDEAPHRNPSSRTVWDNAKDVGRETADAVKGQSRRMGKNVRRLAAEKTQEKQRKFARVIHEFGTVCADSAEQARQEHDNFTALALDFAAERLERSAVRLESAETGDVTRAVRDSARKHPEVVIGVLFGAGLLLGRILQPSSDSSADEDVPPHRRTYPPGVPYPTDPAGTPRQEAGE